MPELTYREYLSVRFGGVLKSGPHAPDGAACALESVNAWRGNHWTDSPFTAGMPDLRALNDAYPDDASRTAALVPVIEAYIGWADWTPERRALVVQSLALLTIQRVLPPALRGVGLEKHAIACETAADLAGAARAAAAAIPAALAIRASRAAARAADAAATAADAAADAAVLASRASRASRAASAAGQASRAADAAGLAADAAGLAADGQITVLNTACQCWLEAAQAGAREESAQ